MLVITVKTGEPIYIRDDIVVVIQESKGSRHSVGIEAPKDVSIQREKVRQRRIDGSENGNVGI